MTRINDTYTRHHCPFSLQKQWFSLHFTDLELNGFFHNILNDIEFSSSGIWNKYSLIRGMNYELHVARPWTSCTSARPVRVVALHPYIVHTYNPVSKTINNLTAFNLDASYSFIDLHPCTMTYTCAVFTGRCSYRQWLVPLPLEKSQVLYLQAMGRVRCTKFR